MAGLINNDRYSLYYQRINLIYQRPEIKASLEIILSVFTVALLIFAAIRPTLTNVASLQKKIEDQEILSKKADNKIAQLFNAQNQLTTYQNQINLYNNAVPDQFSYYDIVGRMEFLGRKHNVTVETVTLPGEVVFGKGKPNGDWIDKLVVADENNILVTKTNFSATGKPENVMTFLAEVENLDRVGMIKNLVFTKESAVKIENQALRVAGEIDFYFYKEQ